MKRPQAWGLAAWEHTGLPTQARGLQRLPQFTACAAALPIPPQRPSFHLRNNSSRPWTPPSAALARPSGGPSAAFTVSSGLGQPPAETPNHAMVLPVSYLVFLDCVPD